MRKIFFLAVILILTVGNSLYAAENKSPGADKVSVYLQDGRELYKQGKYDEAVSVIKRAIDINSTAEAPRYMLAMIYEKQGRNDQAISEWNEFIRLSSNKGLLKSAKIHLERLRRLANE